MDLAELKWTKNVNHQGDDKYWAYQNIDPYLNTFRLNWKTEQAENALKPEEGELILLTHLPHPNCHKRKLLREKSQAGIKKRHI